ncbi:endonuclease [Aurantiacibacter gangjinensis]|uniref:Endonuclease n=1 Tax=Aurantiacibacter gangjinensis TaxID=502682 RepID=A0A0G9MT87_9SPHN|nr:endonuclease [Aurantiacibacter gangjinensis]
MFQPAAYIMASQKGGTLYVGVTSDPVKRIHQHREGLVDGFTKRYRCKRLVWIEFHENMDSAIIREKQLKAGSRKTKIALIEADNADWRDLWDAIIK